MWCCFKVGLAGSIEISRSIALKKNMGQRVEGENTQLLNNYCSTNLRNKHSCLFWALVCLPQGYKEVHWSVLFGCCLYDTEGNLRFPNIDGFIPTFFRQTKNFMVVIADSCCFGTKDLPPNFVHSVVFLRSSIFNIPQDAGKYLRFHEYEPFQLISTR
jgi:hypothetical protein